MSGDLIVEAREGVLWITINRPERGNSLPADARDSLTGEFERAQRDLGVRAIVLMGTGERHFCTGADLAHPTPPAPRPDGAPSATVGELSETMRSGWQRLMRAMWDCDKPIIAGMNGTAAGIGMMLVLAADLVVAGDTAKFAPAFVRRALVPDGGTAFLLVRDLGLHRANELVMFGRDLSADDAHRLGIVNLVVAPELLHETLDAWSAELAAGPTKSLGWSKRLLHSAAAGDLGTFLDLEALLVELVDQTADGREGIDSFVERRDAQYQGW